MKKIGFKNGRDAFVYSVDVKHIACEVVYFTVNQETYNVTFGRDDNIRMLVQDACNKRQLEQEACKKLFDEVSLRQQYTQICHVWQTTS